MPGPIPSARHADKSNFCPDPCREATCHIALGPQRQEVWRCGVFGHEPSPATHGRAREARPHLGNCRPSTRRFTNSRLTSATSRLNSAKIRPTSSAKAGLLFWRVRPKFVGFGGKSWAETCRSRMGNRSGERIVEDFWICIIFDARRAVCARRHHVATSWVTKARFRNDFRNDPCSETKDAQTEHVPVPRPALVSDCWIPSWAISAKFAPFRRHGC